MIESTPIPSDHIRRLLRGRRVLVVDDDEQMRTIYRQFFQDFDAVYTEASNGHDGLAQTNGESFDLIVMDINMPSPDGLQASRMIRKEASSRNKTTPIIGATALKGSMIRERCEQAGMNVVIHKPIEYGAIAQAVTHCLDIDAGVGPPVQPETDHVMAPFVSERVRSTIELMGDGKTAFDTLRRLAEDHQQAIGAQLESLQQAFTAGDMAESERIAHTLKSRSAALGLNAAAAVSGRLEAWAKEGPTGFAPDHIDPQVRELLATTVSGLSQLTHYLEEEAPDETP